MSGGARSGEASDERAAGDGSGEERGRTFGEKLRLAGAAVIGAVVVVLVLQNQEPTQTRFLGWSLEMPRFALLGFVYLLGTATGWFLRRRRG